MHKKRFKADFEELEIVRQFVQLECDKAPGDSDKFSLEMQLAINEAFCNIVKHGHMRREKSDVVISASATPEGVCFEIRDSGATFDSRQIPRPSFDGKSENGYGWYLITKIADRVTYVGKSPYMHHNRLILYKDYGIRALSSP